MTEPPSGFLRTPEDRFQNLPDFPFEPHYMQMPHGDGTMRMHYLDEGDKGAPVILCLHGQATWSYAYRKMIPIFVKAGYRVLAPDFIGFGRSDKLPQDTDYTYQKHVDWIADFCKRTGLKNATGFFFDWGGMFGLRVAVDHRDMFDRLILSNTTLPRGDKLTASLWTLGWRRYVYRQPEFPIGKMVDGMTSKDLQSPTAEACDAPYPDETYKAGPRHLPRLIPASPFHEASGPNREAWKKLEAYDKPVLTLFSEAMVKRGPKPNEFIERIPGAQGQPHEAIPDASFFVIEDQPQLLAEKTLDFIRTTN